VSDKFKEQLDNRNWKCLWAELSELTVHQLRWFYNKHYEYRDSINFRDHNNNKVMLIHLNFVILHYNTIKLKNKIITSLL